MFRLLLQKKKLCSDWIIGIGTKYLLMDKAGNNGLSFLYLGPHCYCQLGQACGTITQGLRPELLWP